MRRIYLEFGVVFTDVQLELIKLIKLIFYFVTMPILSLIATCNTKFSVDFFPVDANSCRDRYQDRHQTSILISARLTD